MSKPKRPRAPSSGTPKRTSRTRTPPAATGRRARGSQPRHEGDAKRDRRGGVPSPPPTPEKPARVPTSPVLEELDDEGDVYVARFVDTSLHDEPEAHAPIRTAHRGDSAVDDDQEPDEDDAFWSPDATIEHDEVSVETLEKSDIGGVPLIAIVGRPNVGKSRLFNRMTGTRFAIVEDMPGVTRDRQYGEGTWDGRHFQVVDTGGFEPDSEDILLSQMREQAELAMRAADIIVFVMDARSGLLPADLDIATMLRQATKPVYYVVNKVDGPRQELEIGEFYQLGVDTIFAISAEHGRNYDELLDAIEPYLPRTSDIVVDPSMIKVAVLGRPNAGKSTLINRLLGEDRLLTSAIPGTTRDAINTYLERDEQRYLFIDTAGIRRKRSIHEQVEKYAVVQSFKSMDRADVVVYMIDATEGLTTQDQRVLGMIHDKGRALVLLLNKWDQVVKDHRTADELVKHLREELRYVTYAPIMTTSALTGQRIHRLFPLIHGAFEQYTRRVSTSKVNNYIREAIRKNPPKVRSRHRLKIYYGSQVAVRPPTIMLSVNDPQLVHFSYERYLMNAFRRDFGFEGTPVKFFFRGRAKSDVGDEID